MIYDDNGYKNRNEFEICSEPKVSRLILRRVQYDCIWFECVIHEDGFVWLTKVNRNEF